jgi:hypothetical protein
VPCAGVAGFWQAQPQARRPAGPAEALAAVSVSVSAESLFSCALAQLLLQ